MDRKYRLHCPLCLALRNTRGRTTHMTQFDHNTGLNPKGSPWPYPKSLLPRTIPRIKPPEPKNQRS